MGWGGVWDWFPRLRDALLRDRLEALRLLELREEVCRLDVFGLRRVVVIGLLFVVREREVLDFLAVDFRFWAMMDSRGSGDQNSQ